MQEYPHRYHPGYLNGDEEPSYKGAEQTNDDTNGDTKSNSAYHIISPV